MSEGGTKKMPLFDGVGSVSGHLHISICHILSVSSNEPAKDHLAPEEAALFLPAFQF